MSDDRESKHIPDNYQLSILIIKISDKLDTLVEGHKDFKTSQEDHKKTTRRELEHLHTRINRLNTFYKIVALVGGGVGMVFTWLWMKMTGKV